MTKIILELTKKADDMLKRFMAYRGATTKAKAAVEIIEMYDIKDDFKRWMEEEKSVIDTFEAASNDLIDKKLKRR